jgi:hypothetical protein
MFLPYPSWYGVKKEELEKKRKIKQENRDKKKAKEEARMWSYPRGGLTYESHEKIRTCILAILANDKDHAYFKNAEGFNSADSRVFHEQFDDYEYCDDHTLLLLLPRLNKYKEQIISLGFKKEDIIPKFNEPKNWFV